LGVGFHGNKRCLQVHDQFPELFHGKNGSVVYLQRLVKIAVSGHKVVGI
jgi:hypothetical protein